MKNFIAPLACLAFTSIFAAPAETKPNSCEPFNPTCREVMVEVFGELLYLQPNGSSLYYAAEAIPLDPTINIPALSPNWNIYEVRPDYAPAFRIGATLLFSDLNTQLTANWERLHTNDSASHTVPLSTDMIGPLYDIGPNSFAYQNGKGTAKFEFDSVDLVFGQQFCAFKRLYPNFYAGANFSRIKQSQTATFKNTAGNIIRTIDNYSTFTGAGPKFGVDFDYRIVWGFFFSGSSSIGLIVGESQNGTTFKSSSPFLVTNNIPEPNTQNTYVPNRTQAIPTFEERLGFSFAGVYDCWKIRFGFGYQAQVYIDAVQSIDMTAPQVIPSLAPGATVESGEYAVGFDRTLSNFILTGPYVNLGLDF